MNKVIGYSYARNIMNSNDVCDTQQIFTVIYLYNYKEQQSLHGTLQNRENFFVWLGFCTFRYKRAL